MEIDQPIFIVGVPRSGTTMLMSILSQHPDLGWFSSKDLKNIFTKEFKKFAYLRRRIFDMRDFPFGKDEFNKTYFSTRVYPVEFGLIWDSTFQEFWNPKISTEYLNLLKKTIIDIIKKNKKKKFISKVPRNSIRISSINKVFSNPKFIHIIRDPRDVVNSMIKRAKEYPTGYFGIPLRNYPKETDSTILHSLQWAQVIKEIKNSANNLNSNQYLEVYYKEFVEEPERKLKEITEFCNLSPYDFLYEKDGKLFNKEGKDTKSLEFRRIRSLKYIHKKHENDALIEKYTSDLIENFQFKFD